MCVWGGVIEINGVSSEGAIRTMEASEVGEGERWAAGAGLPDIP